jgi:hypothetical protein
MELCHPDGENAALRKLVSSAGNGGRVAIQRSSQVIVNGDRWACSLALRRFHPKSDCQL